MKLKAVPMGRAWRGRATAVVWCGLVASGCAAPSALAAAGGAASPLPPSPARVTSIACRSKCSAGAAQPGSLLRLFGRSLSHASRIVFAGGPGAADDTTAPAVRVKAWQADVRVPNRAASGPLVVVERSGARSAPSKRAVTIGAASVSPATPVGRAVVVHGQHVDATISAARIAFDGVQPEQLSYVVKDPAPEPITVSLVRVADGSTVMQWPAVTAAPSVPQVVTWNGLGARGAVPNGGQYAFELYVGAAPTAAATAAQATRPDAVQPFDFMPYVFPIVGPHSFASGAGRFGAPRGGYRHQGQDVMSPCGTPLVAARGGIVKFQAFQSRAGNYVVIDGDGTGYDTVYMHLRDAALVKRGQHVATGQLIGYVGRTGDATACHLHFELWTPPGWYTGGHPVDPLPSLQRWDAQGPPLVAPPAAAPILPAAGGTAAPVAPNPRG